MRRVCLTLLVGLLAGALHVALLQRAAPRGRDEATLGLLRAVSVAGFLLHSLALGADGGLDVQGSVAGDTYSRPPAAAGLADAVMQAVARVYLVRRLPLYPPEVRVALLPRQDLLLTPEVPPRRLRRRDFFEVLAELTVADLLPGARVSRLADGTLRLAVAGAGVSEALGALRQAAAGALLAGENAFEIDGRRFDRLTLWLAAAAVAAGANVADAYVSVQPTDAGAVVCYIQPAAEPPAIFPVPLSPDAPEAVNALALEEALIGAYAEVAAAAPLGVFVALAGNQQYQETATIRLRIAERNDIVLWGDRRFQVEERYYGGWDYVIVHHTASEGATFESIDRYHREERGWAHGAAYHFIIGDGRGMDDGELFATPRWCQQLEGAHVGEYRWNRRAIGVALVGNFEAEKPTEKQTQALLKLSRYLARRFGIPPDHFIGHRECPISSTLCPGRHMDMAAFKRALSEALGRKAAR